MSKAIITVSGSTGNIGHELINLLSAAKSSVRAVLRNFDRARPLPGVTWLQADVSDGRVLDAVLAGTDRLFILTDNGPGFGRTQIAMIHAAERLGIKHVVKLSALGASPHTQSPLAHEHWLAEQALEKSGMSWTILRPHVFMQNWLGEVADTVRSAGAIYAAIGAGKVPFIDARDIAAVAAEALLHPEKHAGQKYVLTGDVAVGYESLAQAISKATGREVVYQSLSMEEMRDRMEKQGINTEMIDSYLALAAYQKAGGPTERVSTSVNEILGRPARTIEDFAKDYRERF
ncbi:NmrA family NAD(P)-binding protein [Parapedobacter lycopersici]|uniref:NmrA family NAD(P)-binding protein n=1 Tax=Parapedobacter lycopersici TaxID=1864939 RepID=UPI003340E7B2